MTLPNPERAIVPLEKFTLYALNPDHPEGKHKARVFAAALGLTLDDAEWLRQQVKAIALTQDAQPAPATPYGERYVIDFELTTDFGTAIVRTAWMVRHHEVFARLTSCYIKESKQ